MFADWLRAYVPRTMAEHHVGFKLDNPGEPSEVKIKRRTGDPHARKIKCVCGPCNNGWMSDIQTAAKPFVVPMLLGRRINFHRKAQTVLAAWAAMTVICGEYVIADIAAASAEDRQYLYNTHRAPRLWRIWIAHAQRQHLTALWFHSGIPVTKDPTQTVPAGTLADSNTQASTILFGQHLLVHTMSSSVIKRTVRRWKFPPALNAKLIQVWPVVKPIVTWPPPAGALRDGEIEFAANYFYNTMLEFKRRHDGPPLR